MVLLFSLSVHEAAHAFAAHMLGDDTAKSLGRVSLNPIRHIDLFGTVLFPLFLIIAHSPVLFGWAKPVPVNVHNLKKPTRDYGWVAFAGPVSNLIIAAVAFSILKFAIFFRGGEAVIILLYYLLMVNVVLAVFNLIPVFPLDGGAVLTALLPAKHRHITLFLRQYGFVIILLLLFTNIFSKILGAIMDVINAWLI